ncbi:MAG TPA: putative 2OG-Fe(II) oxygenase [Sphingomicrobium sp.]|nr:putative 2OG-Fe(II) oxygenase [Sphingomicrobium sp.]
MAASVRQPVDPEQVVQATIPLLDTPGASAKLADIERALEQSPQDARLWHLKGLIHRQEDRRELAIPALERAARLAPELPLVAHGLARTLYEAGLPSVDAYARALKLKPGDPAILSGLVAALISERRIDDALAGLERALERSPLWIEGHVLLSELRWTEGERDGFARSFAQALALHPGNLDLRRQQIGTLLHAEQYDQLLGAIAEGRKALGEQLMFDANEAVVYSELNEIERADALFRPLAEIADSTVQLRRARHLLRSWRPGEASDLIDRWLGHDEQAAFWPYAAIAWRMTGDSRWAWLEGDPRFVGVYDLADRLPPMDRLAETLRTLHTTRGQPLEQSVRGGTQTDGHLFQRIDPVIVELREAIRAAVAEHAASLPDHDPDHPLLRSPREPIAFTGAWSVRLQGGGHHANHVHPKGWLSSALYIVLPPDLGEEGAGWLTLGEPQAQLGLGLPPVRTVEPKPGRLVLFPSTMWHGTRPFRAGERLTVAFDVAVPVKWATM